MLKFTGILLCALLVQFSTMAQQTGETQGPTFGIHFLFNDFHTASSIRTTSITETMNRKEFGRISNMSPGLALNYINGLSPNFDFTTSLAASFLEYPFRNGRTMNTDALLLEADASIRGKMFSNEYWFVPYVQAGVGVSKYRGYYGAFIPAGLGIQISFFEEAYLLINSQYRIPVTQTANYHFFHSIGIASNLGKWKD